MTYLIWLLRIIHIVAGIFWVGGTLIMTYFVGPAVGATGEAGQKVVGHLMNNLKFSQRMSAASGLTILAGLILYGLDGRAGAAWFRSEPHCSDVFQETHRPRLSTPSGNASRREIAEKLPGHSAPKISA